jgi:hypothetical protein
MRMLVDLVGVAVYRHNLASTVPNKPRTHPALSQLARVGIVRHSQLMSWRLTSSLRVQACFFFFSGSVFDKFYALLFPRDSLGIFDRSGWPGRSVRALQAGRGVSIWTTGTCSERFCASKCPTCSRTVVCCSAAPFTSPLHFTPLSIPGQRLTDSTSPSTFYITTVYFYGRLESYCSSYTC